MVQGLATMLFSTDLRSMRAAAALVNVLTSCLTPDYARRLSLDGQNVVPVMVALLSEDDGPGVRLPPHRCGPDSGRSDIAK